METKTRRIISFTNISLDGYYANSNSEMSWAHNNDPEWDEFVEGNASSGGILLFGRITYEMMASFWPSENAKQHFPVVAEQMNKLPKIVLSTTLKKASWNNTLLLKDGIAELKKIKNEPGADIAILGSGSIVMQLAQQGLIDEFQVVVIPVVLGNGKTIFKNISKTLKLKLVKSRVFKNGNVLLCYEN